MTDNSQYLQMFFDESEEYIQMLNENILDLENNPDDKEVLDELFRAAHSMKGMAASMGFNILTELTHKLENLLDQLRNDNLKVTTQLVDLLFSGIDYIEDIVAQIKESGSEEINLDDYLEQFEKYLNNVSQDSNETVQNSDSEIIAEVGNGDKNLSLNQDEIVLIEDNKKETDITYYIEVLLDNEINFINARASMVLKTSEKLGYLVKSNPDIEKIKNSEMETGTLSIIIVSNFSPEELENELSTINDVEQVQVEEMNLSQIKEEFKSSTIKKDTSQPSKNSSGSITKGKNKKKFEVSSTVRVDIKKLDTLMNMIGELLINKTRLQSLSINQDDYKEVLPQLDRVTMELHHTVMQIRMETVGVMFNRFPRMIRDLAKKENKEINFIIEGEDTELDRSIIDELGDPLTHILRNAVDHGIEKPSVREKNGKKRQGTIILRAYSKGSEIMIEVEDDGGGIDQEKLVEKAINTGVITQNEAQELSEKEKLELIFHPGLSTSKEVTDVSGRGVGMDIVKKALEDLDGEVQIQSKIDKGTKFTISLPLTLAITEALTVKINEEIFAIPLNNIQETLIVKREEIKQVKGEDVITLREHTIPLIDGRKSLNLDTDYGLYKTKEEFPVVLVQNGDNMLGLIVDEFLQQQEIVIKSLGEYLGKIKNISGATIIGDGEIALILDTRNIA